MANNSSLYGDDTNNLGASSSNYTTLYSGGGAPVPGGDNVIISGTLTVNGCAILTDCSTFSLLPQNATTINFGGAATTMTIGSTTGGVITLNKYNLNSNTNIMTLPGQGILGDTYGDGTNNVSIQPGPGGYAGVNSENQQQYFEADDNAIYIGTNYPSSTKNWQFNKDGTTQFPSYKFPYADGTANQVLTTNGAGVLSFASISSLGIVTSITGTANQVIASSPTGAVTLSLPQDIATTSNPTFNGVIAGLVNIGVSPTPNNVIRTVTGSNADLVLFADGTGIVSVNDTMNVLGGNLCVSSGKLGVNTTTPIYELDVRDGGDGYVQFALTNTEREFVITNNAGDDLVSISVRQPPGSGGYTNRLQFDATGGNQWFASGSLGVNNATPAYTLDVSGQGRFTQDIIAGTQVKINGATSGSTSLIQVDGSADVNYYLPTAQGASSTVLTNDGSGNLSWAATGNPFDQSLNTTDNVIFNTVTATNGVDSSLIYTDEVRPLNNGYFTLTSENYKAEIQLGETLGYPDGYITAIVNSNNWSFISDGRTSFPNYTFPAADGAVNEVLTTDGLGNVFWALPGGGGSTFGNITIAVDTDNTISTTTGNLILQTEAGVDSGVITINAGADQDIVIQPNATGRIKLSTDDVIIGDLNTSAAITTNGTGSLYLNTNNYVDSGQMFLEAGVDGNIVLAPYTTGTGQVKTYGNFQVNDGTFFVDSANGRVGVNTTGPGQEFTISDGGDGYVQFGMINTERLWLVTNNFGDNLISYSVKETAGPVVNRLQFDATGGDQWFPSGNLGVGTATPAYALDVSGTGRFTSNLIATGGITLNGTTSGYTDIIQPAVGANIQYVLPAAQGAVSTVLTNDGSGNLSWALPGGGGSTFGNITVGVVTDNTISTTTGDLVLASASGTIDATTSYMFVDTVSANQIDIGFPTAVSTINDQTTTTTSVTPVSISSTTRSGMKVLISIVDNVSNARHIVEALLLKQGSTAYITTYAEMYSSAALATFSADISAGNLRLLATPASANSTTFTVIRTTIN